LLRTTQFRLTASVIGLLLTGTANIAAAAPFCPTPNLSQWDELAAELNSNSNGEDLTVVADNATLGNDGVTTLEGNVAMSREEGILRADRLEYNEAKQSVKAQGNVRFATAELDVDSQAAQVDLAANNAKFTDAKFQVRSETARGSALQIEIAGDGSPDMQHVVYTTCPPGNESWLLRADRIRLDQASGQGKANQVRLIFKGVPILYLPYMQFPFTDQRQSGLLAPTFGSSDNSGFGFGIPYYWNIAPNMDATFTPSFTSKRGFRLDNELRGITGTPLSERRDGNWWQAQATANIDWLPDDKVVNDSRRLVDVDADYRHQKGDQYWRWDNQLVSVSDDNWFDDFGSSLADVSQPFYVSRTTGSWQQIKTRRQLKLQLIAEDHEPLSTTTTNLISRAPELSFNGRQQIGQGPFYYGLESQHGRYVTDNSNSHTSREHYQPWVGVEYRQPAWWISARADYLATRWETRQNGSVTNKESRRLSLYTAQAGAHLEKTSHKGTHVIEPTIGFRAAPTRDQSNIPLLDTHAETLYWHNLNGDQLSGLDRVRDGQQISSILSSEWYNLKGERRLALRVGQIWYLENPTISIAGETLPRNYSTTLFEANSLIGKRWSITATGEWDTQDSHLDHSQVRVDYKNAVAGDFYVGLRQRRNLFRQASIGGQRQLSNNWHISADGLYSLDDKELLEADLKLRYQTCCWAVDFGGKRVLRDSSGEPDVGIFVQLELTGLAQIGSQ